MQVWGKRDVVGVNERIAVRLRKRVTAMGRQEHRGTGAWNPVLF